MKRAIRNALGGRISWEEAGKIAELVMNFFGYEDRVLDNHLESEDRNIFSMLEDLGLVRVSQEELFLKVGQRWQINYWVLKKKEILRKAMEVPSIEEAFSYQRFYEKIWNTMERDVIT